MEKTRILVWDLPVRVCHWLLVASFVGAFLTGQSERIRAIHVALGYTFLGLLAFRLVWGVIGSRYARFASFAFGPQAVVGYLKSLATGRPDRYVGHNPAGGWAIYAILALGVVTGFTGYAVNSEAGAGWIESLHEGAANILFGLVIFHVVGVVVSSFMHSENLVAAMVSGRKRGFPSEAIGNTRWWVVATVVAAIAVLSSGIGNFRGALLDSLKTTTSKEDGYPRHFRYQYRFHDD